MRTFWADLLRSSFWRVLAYACTVLVVAIVNPFGVVDWSQQRSHELWERLYAPYYHCAHSAGGGKCTGASEARGRDAITVVVLDEKSRDDLAAGRALTNFDMRRILNTVVNAPGDTPKPSAIFFDLLLGHTAPPGQTLDQVMRWPAVDGDICLLERPGAPAFSCMLARVAQLTRYEYADPKDPTRLRGWKKDTGCYESPLAKLRCIRVAGGIPILFADPRNAHVLMAGSASPPPVGMQALALVAIAVPVDADTRRYPLATPTTADEREDAKHFYLSAAATLYADYCVRHREHCRKLPIGAGTAQRPGPQWRPAFDAPLEVQWGIGDPGQFAAEIDKTMVATADSACTTASSGRSFGRLFTLVVAGIAYPEKPQCLYSNTVPFGLLDSGDMDSGALAFAFSGKTVLIGGDLPESNDVVPAAPLGAVPGVYYHAMALDNLIAEGSGYPKQSAPIVGGLRMTWADLHDAVILIVTLAAFAVPILYLERRNAALSSGGAAMGRAERLRELRDRAAIVAIVAVVVGSGLWLLSGWWMFVPLRFNIALTTIVILGEVVKLLAVVLDPIRRRLVPRHEFFHFLGFGDRPEAAGHGPPPAAD